MTGAHRRLERIPSLRTLAAHAAAILTGLIVALLQQLAGYLLEVHEQLCTRCRRDPQLYRRLVNTRADGVCWEAFATAHDTKGATHAASDRER